MNKVTRLWLQFRHSPLFWILLAAAIMRLAALSWGLPGADGWDDDGVAPRNFLVGLAQTYTPGSHFTYPPLHMFLLALLTAPGWIAALIAAPSLHPQDVIATMIQVPTMTFFSVVARLVSLVFSLGTIFVIAKMGEMLAGKRAGWLAAGAAALNAALVYYGQVSNLDGPALFWAVLSLWLWMRLIAGHEAHLIRWACLSAAAAMATKDQAYALFLPGLLFGLGLWLLLDSWPRQNARRLASGILLWSGVSLIALLFIDGALTNPHGFADRIAFLSGPASADYAQYSADWAGRLAILQDLADHSVRAYPLLMSLLGVLGLAVAVRRSKASGGAGLLPFWVALSFTLAFNFVAQRTETRFLLPQTVLLAVYIGVAGDVLIRWAGQGPWRWPLRAVLAGVAAAAFIRCAGIDAAFLADPRYDAENWLRTHARPGDRIETYGLNVYLPRFPQGMEVVRVDSKALKKRNPLPAVREVLEPYTAIDRRRPRLIVVSGYWVSKFLNGNMGVPGKGRLLSKVHQNASQDMDAKAHFDALFSGKLPYRLAHVSQYNTSIGPSVDDYESLAQAIFIFEKKPDGDLAPIVTGRKSAAGTPSYRLYGSRAGWVQPGVTPTPAARLRGLAFVSRGYHIDQTWGWDA